jgi:hypothetical protein
MISRLAQAAAVSLVALAVAAPGVAFGDSHLTIESPTGLIKDATPRFSGTAYTLDELDGFEAVIVTISSEAGRVQTLSTPALNGPDWSVVAGEALADGTYTAQAEQGPHTSAPVEFTVDATPPVVAMTTPSNGSSSSGTSQPIGGTAGTLPGDLPAITIQVFAGESVASPALLQTLVVQASEGKWSAAVGGLGPGTYTAQATQRDQAGNTGSSSAVTFTITSPAPPPAGPTASFSWVPSSPLVGESVALASSSTDLASPISGFAWALTPSAPFTEGKPLLLTSFATPGPHVVRLRVTDAAGRSSIATQSIPVRARRAVLMAPFPIVRIAGALTAAGARINLLTVQVPVSARVTVLCRGRGCRTKSETRTAKASSNPKHKASTVLLAFARFERSYRARTVLTIMVSKPGKIGKYTSFVIRHGKLPVRSDACLAAGGSHAISCSTS